MNELDLTEAIEAGRRAVLGHHICQPDAETCGCYDVAVRAAAPIIERAVRAQTEAKIKYLTDEVAFWKDQQKFAASTAATIADLDEEAPALRQMLRAEKERRRRAEDEVDRLSYRLQQDEKAPETAP